MARFFLGAMLLAGLLLFAARSLRGWSRLGRGARTVIVLYLIFWATLAHFPFADAIVWDVFGGSAHFADSGRGPDGHYYLVSMGGERIEVSKATYRFVYRYQYWSFWGPAIAWWTFFAAAGAYRWRRPRTGATTNAMENELLPFPAGRL